MGPPRSALPVGRSTVRPLDRRWAAAGASSDRSPSQDCRGGRGARGPPWATPRRRAAAKPLPVTELLLRAAAGSKVSQGGTPPFSAKTSAVSLLLKTVFSNVRLLLRTVFLTDGPLTVSTIHGMLMGSSFINLLMDFQIFVADLLKSAWR